MINLIKHLLIFGAGFLSFQIQLIATKEMLPDFGGSSGTWLGSLLFFQAYLFLGYLLVHKILTSVTKFTIYSGFLWISYFLLYDISLTFQEPIYSLIFSLGTGVGLIYLNLLAISPLIQKFMPDDNPYRFYATSNLGAFSGLLTYPFIFEPLMGLELQKNIWHIASALIVIFAVALLWEQGEENKNEEKVKSDFKFLTVLIFAALGTWALGSFSSYITQDIAGFPLLWVIPLSLFLLSYVWVFSNNLKFSFLIHFLKKNQVGIVEIILLIYLSGILIRLGMSHKYLVLFIVLLISFIIYTICNLKIRQEQPSKGQLTNFYLAIALGGAIGGAVINIVFPVVLKNGYDLPILLLTLVLFLLIMQYQKISKIPTVKMASMLILLVIFSSLTYVRNQSVIYQSKNFYGFLRILERPDKRVMYHGQIIHGEQSKKDPTEPTIYYQKGTGLGKTFKELQMSNSSIKVAAIGLGVGVVASYGRHGDYFDFYEIDADVIELAQKYFSYLKYSPATKEFILGDGRKELSQRAVNDYNLIIVDAFSGDSIPTHLLTQEAFSLYLSKSATGGYIAIHISNNHLDLRPVILSIAKKLNQKVHFEYNSENNGFPAIWAIIKKDGEVNFPILNKERTMPEAFYKQNQLKSSIKGLKTNSYDINNLNNDKYLWTDDFTNVLSILK